MLKRFLVVASLVGVLAPASVAAAAGTLSGTYRTTIHSNALGGDLKGTWTIAFKSGTYTVTDNGKAVLKGKITAKGSRLTWKDKSGPDSCPTAGVYTFKLNGSKLKFTRVSDSACTGRATVLAGSFTKID
jgi:hypothetical protein